MEESLTEAHEQQGHGVLGYANSGLLPCCQTGEKQGKFFGKIQVSL
jgi:hypothetical protein